MPETRATRAGVRVAYGVSVTLLAVVVALVLLGLTGQLTAAASDLFDPGAVVRFGLPAARVVHDLAAAVTIGTLALGAFVLPPERRSAPDPLSGARQAAARTALIAAVVWLVAAVLVIVFTAADLAGMPLSTPGFSSVLFSVVTQVDLGRALGVGAVVVAAVVNLLVIATRVTQLAAASVLSLLALLPLALVGHSAGSADHMNSVDSLAFHLVGATLWIGGLAAVLLLSRRLGSQLPVVAARYSTLALVCFVAVAGSGVVNAALRLGSPANLGTPYGLLVLGKVIALVALGAFGAVHRSRTIPRLGERPALFRRIAAVEIAVMAVTAGLAVALSRSAPPASDDLLDPVASLLGHPQPPPFSLVNYLTAFYPELIWLVTALVLAGVYVAGVLRLQRRGDRWPLGRTIFWLLGCALLVFFTSGGPGLYGRLAFSTHMLQHMSLMIVVPMPLVFGAPITLALRALRPRKDGSLGARELISRLLHAPLLGVLGHPVTAVVLFTGSLIVFYYTGLFQLAMFTHAGHVLMTAHFLLTGYLFIWSLVGVDPGPARPPYPLRLVLLLMTLGFHAFFGITLMGSGQVLAPDWWAAIGRTDTAALLADQQFGGAIAWGTGDIPALLIGVALIVGWVRSDADETRRKDRRADRDGDAELKAYNEQLAAMSRRDGPR